MSYDPTEDRYPLSRPQNVDALPPRGLTVDLAADAEERRLLAEVLDIVAVDRLEATLTVTPWRKTGAKVTGKVSADVRQACVVTLDPVEEHVEEEVELTFLPAAEIGAPGTEVEIDIATYDPPEPLEGRTVDLGAIMAESMALGLDPYPRKPGVEFTPFIEDDGSNDEAANPFTALGQLRRDE